MNAINNIICFYSKYSSISQEFSKLLERQKQHKIDMICIDNKQIKSLHDSYYRSFLPIFDNKVVFSDKFTEQKNETEKKKLKKSINHFWPYFL